MENKLHTQEISNNYIETKQKVFNTVKDNLNYIYIVLMIIANCLISLLKIEDGYIGLRYPSSALGWCLWFAAILIQTFIGVMILNAFRRQGVKNGHKAIKTTYDEYIKVSTNNKDRAPRSLKQYLKIQNTRDSLSKAFIYVFLSMFVGSVAISANLNNLLSLIVNIIFAVGFGIKTMLDAEEYVVTELIVWYKIEIEKINKKKGAKVKDDK